MEVAAQAAGFYYLFGISFVLRGRRPGLRFEFVNKVLKLKFHNLVIFKLSSGLGGSSEFKLKPGAASGGEGTCWKLQLRR